MKTVRDVPGLKCQACSRLLRPPGGRSVPARARSSTLCSRFHSPRIRCEISRRVHVRHPAPAPIRRHPVEQPVQQVAEPVRERRVGREEPGATFYLTPA